MSAVARYRRVQAETASPSRLMVLLFEKAAAEMGRGRACFDQSDWRQAEAALSRATDIVIELKSSLDPAQAPELCKTLDELYAFVLARLFEGRRTKNGRTIDDARRVFEPIATAFAQAVQQT